MTGLDELDLPHYVAALTGVALCDFRTLIGDPYARVRYSPSRTQWELHTGRAGSPAQLYYTCGATENETIRLALERVMREAT